MKVNSNQKNLRRNITVNIQPISFTPDTDLLINKWREKLEIVNEILEKGQTNRCYQDVYQKINDLLLYKIPEQINESFSLLIQKHSENYCRKLVELSNENNFDVFFEKFNFEWEKINQNFLLLRKLLIKFEKKFFSKNLSTQTIYSLFLENLSDILKKDKTFIFLLSERIFIKINETREYFNHNLENLLKNNISLTNDDKNSISSLVLENSHINLGIISKSISFLWKTGFYKDIFQEYFISNSTCYYTNLANLLISNLSIENYIKFVELTFESETFLVNSFLNEFSLKKILNELENKLINSKKSEILEKFFYFDKNDSTKKCEDLYLRLNQLEFLKKLYVLFKRIKIEDDLKTSWINHINYLCNKIYSQHSNNYLYFFQNILELKKNIDYTVKESFNNDDKFKTSGKDGFVKSINLKPNFIADYFARYIDHILTESDTEKQYIFDKIDEFMLIFRHLDAKDMFEGFFIKKLSYRLLYNLSNFKEGEAYLIEKLKCECGSVFVTKSEEMINDIESSIESTFNFNKKNNQNIEYNFYVLSSASWPLSTKIHEGYISNKITELQNNYSLFYKEKNSRKALRWHLPFCTAELFYKQKNLILEVSGVQCAVLVCFNNTKNYISLKNDCKGMSLKKILEITGLDKDVVMNAVKNLTKTVPLLVKVGDIAEEVYKLNEEFVINKERLFINDFSNKEEVEEIKEVEERNHEERKYVVDCLIMKVLKSKKQMFSEDILCEVRNMIKFSCETSLILTRLNNLVTNKYIFKDDNDQNLYKYN